MQRKSLPIRVFAWKIDRPDKRVWKEWVMSTMKNLSISILEFVLSQPAHKLPAVFDLEQCPFPHGEIPLEDILEEIVRLRSSGLIEANVLKGIDGKPYRVQIRYVTLGGKNYLEGSNPLAVQWSFLKKILGVVLVVAVLIGFLLLGGLGRRKGGSVGGDVVPAATPTPTPEATPSPTATPEPTPTPTPEATPTPTATPSPTPAPSASPKPKPKPKETPRTTPDSKPAPSTSPKPRPRETPHASPNAKASPSASPKLKEAKEKPSATPAVR